MTPSNVLASLAVRDIDKTLAWYERLLGARASRPMPQVAEWIFEGGGGLQIYELPERAGACSCTIITADMDKQVRDLEKMGIDTRERTSSERVKTVMIQDADGNHLAFAQPVDSSLAH